MPRFLRLGPLCIFLVLLAWFKLHENFAHVTVAGFVRWLAFLLRPLAVAKCAICLSQKYTQCTQCVQFVLTNHFSQANGRIAIKLAHDGLQVRVHPGCAQG